MRLLPRSALALSLAAFLAACSTAPSGGSEHLALYEGRPADGMKVVAADPDTEQVLSASSITVAKAADTKYPNSLVSVTKSGKAGADDALTLRWKDIWKSVVRVEGAPLDLGPYLARGTLAFDLNVAELAKGGIQFTVGCGAGCERTVSYVAPGRAAQGKGWRHVELAMRCFVRDGDHFDAVSRPFSLEGTNSGEVSVANIAFHKVGTGNTPCPDLDAVAVTPAMLEESWALDWWQPRHQQKLDEVRALKAAGKNPELIFIGDSITHGWEKEGAPTWQRNYARYNALDLGFSGDRTENVLWRLQHGEVDGINPKVAVLMFGTNNSGHRRDKPAVTAAAIKRNIEELQRRLPASKILLLAIFPRDEKPGGELRQLNEQINAILATYADNKQVYFANLNRAFLQADGTLSKDIMPDLLHPNAKGYEIWADAMRPALEPLLK